jgi:hypothetical protein
MKQSPSERNRAVGARIAQGAKATAVAAEFKLSSKRVTEIARQVDRYNRGVAILQSDPPNLLGHELVGRIPPLARMSLRAAGIDRLEDMDGVSLVDLLGLPNIGRRSATILIDLSAEMKDRSAG